MNVLFVPEALLTTLPQIVTCHICEKVVTRVMLFRMAERPCLVFQSTFCASSILFTDVPYQAFLATSATTVEMSKRLSIPDWIRPRTRTWVLDDGRRLHQDSLGKKYWEFWKDERNIVKKQLQSISNTDQHSICMLMCNIITWHVIENHGKESKDRYGKLTQGIQKIKLFIC